MGIDSFSDSHLLGLSVTVFEKCFENFKFTTAAASTQQKYSVM